MFPQPPPRRAEAKRHAAVVAAQPRLLLGGERGGRERLALQVVEQQQHGVDARAQQRAEDLEAAEEGELRTHKPWVRP